MLLLALLCQFVAVQKALKRGMTTERLALLAARVEEMDRDDHPVLQHPGAKNLATAPRWS
jgi:hypothetical protein